MTTQLPEVRSYGDVGGCYSVGYYCRGHLDAEIFSAAYKQSTGQDWAEDWAAALQVRQIYARFCGDWSEGYRQSILSWCKAGRGAFPVTVAETGL